MPRIKCIVKDCNSKKFCFIFPSLNVRNPKVLSLNKARIKKWEECLGIGDVQSKINYICGRHFVKGKPASVYNTEDIDWAPTLNLGINKDEQYETSEKNEIVFVKTEAPENIEDEDDVLIQNEPICDTSDDIEFIEVVKNEVLEAVPEDSQFTKAHSETIDLGQHLCRMCLKTDVTKLKTSVFQLIDKTYKLADLILCLLRISFKPNEPYVNVCNDCVEKIQIMFKWYNFFLENNSKLTNFLLNVDRNKQVPKNSSPSHDIFDNVISASEIVSEANKDIQNEQNEQNDQPESLNTKRFAPYVVVKDLSSPSVSKVSHQVNKPIIKTQNIKIADPLSLATDPIQNARNIPDVPILTRIRVKKRKLPVENNPPPNSTVPQKIIKIPRKLIKSKLFLNMEANGKVMQIPLNIAPNKSRHVVTIKQKDSENTETPKFLGIETLFQLPVYEDPPLKCFICKEMQANQEEFDKHLLFHGKNPPFRCVQCETYSGSPEQWNNHMKRHNEDRPYGCKPCNVYYTKNYKYEAHMKKHDKNCKYFCCHCGMEFSKLSRLNEHEALHNGGAMEKKFKCRFCDKKFVSNEKLKYHEVHHRKLKPHKCLECDKFFETKVGVIYHMEKHVTEKTIPCGFCDRMFAYDETKKRHIKTSHMPKIKKKISSSDTNDKSGSSSTPKNSLPMYLIGTRIPSKKRSRVMCTICTQVFRTYKELIEHIDSDHPDNNLTFYTCPEDNCDDRFLTESAVVNHKKYKHSYFKCRFCTQSFLTQGKRLTHESNHKTKLICPKEGCGKKFTSKGYLANHLKFTHSNIKNYSCSFCDKKFKKSCERKLHERIHTGDRPYVCTKCGNTFSDPSTLLKHNKRHAKRENAETEKSMNNESETIEKVIKNLFQFSN